jgi:dipeptidase E
MVLFHAKTLPVRLNEPIHDENKILPESIAAAEPNKNFFFILLLFLVVCKKLFHDKNSFFVCDFISKSSIIFTFVENLTGMKLLLLSNSTNQGEKYLDYPKYLIKEFLGATPVHAVFIPYAAVTFSYAEYEDKVNERFREIGHRVTGIHRYEDPKAAIAGAEAIVVGGGNTWKLVRMLHENGLMPLIRGKVLSGTPYIGWSAGSNVACPTLRTTNDMPIADPIGFDTLGLVPFQINPHYLDEHPANHGGETREMRIIEFIAENRTTDVVGLREGTMLRLENNKLELLGNRTARLFRYGETPEELSSADDLGFLMEE